MSRFSPYCNHVLSGFAAFCVLSYAYAWWTNAALAPDSSPYVWLMITQMLCEMAFRSHTSTIQMLHHIAMLLLCVGFVCQPSAEYQRFIHDNIPAEFTTVLLIVRNVRKRLGYEELLWVKALFFTSFMYTRFIMQPGWSSKVHPHVLNAVFAHLSIPLRYGLFACVWAVHGCSLFWGGQMIAMMVDGSRKFGLNQERTRQLDQYTLIPAALWCVWYGSTLLACTTCVLAMTSFGFHRTGGLGWSKVLDISAIFWWLWSLFEDLYDPMLLGVQIRFVCRTMFVLVCLCCIVSEDYHRPTNKRSTLVSMFAMSLPALFLSVHTCNIGFIGSALLALSTFIELKKRGLGRFNAFIGHIFLCVLCVATFTPETPDYRNQTYQPLTGRSPFPTR